MLEREVYKALEEIVGPENITDEPAILDTYAYQWGIEVERALRGEEPSRFGYRPEAVVLPSCTSEVQAVVRICNKFGLKFKAHSTGLGNWAAVSRQGVILLDLRRMNRIIKIDEKNMYAVIEPYVTGAQLQAELIKRGLTHHLHGAGPQTSPLASHTSMCGPGFTSVSTGFSGRNLLAVEWVLPTGDILRLGSLNLGEEWFSGDGPGPSLRGVMRGFMGTLGGLGVFTKCAIKVYPWPGPKEWKVRGTIPNYEFEVPPYWEMYIITYSDWSKLEEAYYRIGEAEVATIANSTSPEGVATMLSSTRDEAISRILEYSGKIQMAIVVLVTAHTEREFNYKTRVMSEIIKETGGVDLVEKGEVKIKSINYAEGVRNMWGSAAFRFTSCFQSTHGSMDTTAMALKIAKVNKDIKLKYIRKELIGDDRGEGIWTTIFEHGHFQHLEVPTIYDPTDPESCRGFAEYLKECNEADVEHKLGVPFFIIGDNLHNWFGPYCNNYQIWLRKIKKEFDPNNTSDPGHYVSSEES